MADAPVSFFDIGWLAVRNGDAQTIARILDLSHSIPATWQTGIDVVCGDYWLVDAPIDSHRARVFVTPRIRGWTLVVGGSFSLHRSDDLEPRIRWTKELSRAFGDALLFTSQGRMDCYGWLVCARGDIIRHFLWDDGVFIDDGEPLCQEAELKAAFVSEDDGEEWAPSEATVMAIAGELSIDPTELDTQTSTGAGYLFATAWGRSHGIIPKPR